MIGCCDNTYVTCNVQVSDLLFTESLFGNERLFVTLVVSRLIFMIVNH